MKCLHVNLGGRPAIVCGSSMRRASPCAECGARSARLCDFKIRGRTCDRPLCERCTTTPAPDKDLCPMHARMYRAWLDGRTNSTDGVGP